MKRTNTIIIGGGQAGLAMSYELGARNIDHVVLERGRVGERWRSERWDSLRLLTPNWQSRLPGWSYRGKDPNGYMSRDDVVSYLDGYARSFDAPVETGVEVACVERAGDGFRVSSRDGIRRAANVVIATGHCDRPRVPMLAGNVAPEVAQVVPSNYRNPDGLRDGGVLVVGASATGLQLAAEIARSGRPVTLAVGRHIRLPRRYRGRDIMDWFDTLGVMTETAGQVYDVNASRRQPSLQLIGSDDHRSIDLGTLQSMGVRLVGHAIGAVGRRIYFADDLADSMRRAHRKMNEQLDRVDRHINVNRLNAPVERRPVPIAAPDGPRSIHLGVDGIRTVLWATGYRREYPWLHLPVLDARGEIVHDGGVTAEPGLYALGLNFMRRRNSSFIDGVGLDASELADHIEYRMAGNRLSVA